MKKILEINNLTNVILTDVSIEVKEGQFISLIGPNNSGKTELLKCILGIEQYAGEIKINETTLDIKTRKKIYQNISILFENPDSHFLTSTVKEELTVQIKNISKKEIEDRLEKIVNFFGLETILQRNPRELSGSEKQIVAFASAIIKRPDILIIDEGLNRITNTLRDVIMKYLKDNKITTLYASSLADSTIYSDYIYVLKNGEIISSEKQEETFNNEKMFSSLGLNQPFMVSLSNKLKFYELIDKTYFDMEKLVNKLWK